MMTTESMPTMTALVRTSTATVPQDSGAAYVTRPGGPPDNGAYRTAAYAIAMAIYLGYIVVLLRRMARERAAAR